MIDAKGHHVVPLKWIVEWATGRRDATRAERWVGISFDDGADLDYYDYDHVQYGLQLSFINILQRFREAVQDRQPHLHASAFVIASPLVRRELDSLCLRELGLRGMSSDWWAAARGSGLLEIHNHSWDHNHPAASVVCEENQHKGTFTAIDTYKECRAEVADAAAYIHKHIWPAWPTLFAYPWGQSSDYMRQQYLPMYQHEHGTAAAFGAAGGYVRRGTLEWDIPRFVSGAASGGWNSPEELIDILEGRAGA